MLFAVLGESEVVARLYSVTTGTLWVLAVFAWTRCVVGRAPALIAAVLFAVAPESVFQSLFIRFYALHGLAFWLGAIRSIHRSDQRAHTEGARPQCWRVPRPQ